MDAIRIPYVRLTNISTAKTAATTQINGEKKIKFDKYSDRLGLSPSPSKEFVIIKRILLSEKCLQKSYLQTQTNQPMMSISNYVLLFGVDQELTHFLINDCDGKIPIRFGKKEKHQSEASVNIHMKDELSEWCSDEGSSLKMRKLATHTTMSQQNYRKCSCERRAKRKTQKRNCVKKCKRRGQRLKKNHKAPPHKESRETELPMAQAVKLLSRGVISVCKPSLDCDVPKEVDTKRSQQDADSSIIEIIDDLSCLSVNSVIVEEHDQIPIMVESEDDETHTFPKKETTYSINKSTMTEDFLRISPISESLEQINNEGPLFKEKTNKTPDFKKDDQESINRTASNGRAQINSNFLGIFKEKSNAQNQTNTDPDTTAITEESLNRLNNEEAFLNVNKVTSRNGDTTDESLISIYVDDLSVDSTVIADANLRQNIVETSPTVDMKCTPINCLFQNSDVEEISKQMVELIECQSTSEITSSSDRNRCNNATTAQSISCTAVQQMLLKDLQLMVQKFYEFSHSEKHARKVAVCQTECLSTESTMVSEVDDRNSESLSISAKSSVNLNDEYNSTEAEKVTPACFDTTDCATQISEDELTPENDYSYSIKDIYKCNNINSTSQSYQVTSRNKISKNLKTYFTRKKVLKAKEKSKKIYRRHKNNNKKTIAIHSNRKTIRAPIQRNDLPRKPRFKKKASQPVSTVENDKNISNCDEITNNENNLFEPSTESAKLEDTVKNNADLHENDNEKTIAIHSKRKTIGAPISKNILPKKPRLKKNNIDSASQPVSTVENDKSFSNCNEITNNENNWFEPSTESAKLEDIVKNNADTHKNDNEKTIAIHSKRKTIRAPIQRNDLPRKPRLKKKTIDSASQPVSTVENDKNISNCDEITNNENNLFEPSTESAKLEDTVKNNADLHENDNEKTIAIHSKRKTIGAPISKNILPRKPRLKKKNIDSASQPVSTVENDKRISNCNEITYNENNWFEPSTESAKLEDIVQNNADPHKNDSEKTIVIHSKSKTIRAPISKNNLPRKPRLKKKNIDSASQPFSTIENDKSISNCDEITNNENNLFEPSTESAKLEDVVKNNANPHKNDNEKTIAIHSKRKTIRAPISKNNLPRKPRFKKKNIDSASQPISTVENDKSISNCDEIANNENNLLEPSTESAKLEDIVKNSADPHKNDNKKTIAIHSKRKTIGAPILKNNLPRKPRLKKKNIDSASQPISTVENDKSISICDEITNTIMVEPSTQSAKLEDIVKNNADLLEKLNPAIKPNIEDEVNDNQSSEVAISNITVDKNIEKGMREEINQILVFIDKNILIVDPVEGVSINPNTSKTSLDGSHLNTLNLVNSEKQTDAMIQSESENFNKTSDHLTMNKNDTDSALPDKVKNATVPPKRKQPQRRVTLKKDKKVDIVQKSPIINKCISANRESMLQLKQLRVVCERYSVEIYNKNTKKNNSTIQEEHCDSTTAVIENKPEISSPVEACDSRETVACNTDPEYFDSYPLFYVLAEDEKQINSDWQSKTSLKTDDVEMNTKNIIGNEISIVDNEIICFEENSKTKESDKKILSSDYSIGEIQEEVQTISGALLSSPPLHKSSHLPITAAPTFQKTATRIAQPLREPDNTEEIVFRSKLPNSTNLEYEKLVVDAILNTEISVGVENQEEYSVVQYIPKNNSEVMVGNLIETISDTSCNFNFKPISIGSPLELETNTKLTSDVISDTHLVNLSSVDNGAYSKTLSNTKYSDSETVSSTTLSNGIDLEKTIQFESTDREEQFNMVSNSTIIDILPHSEVTPPQKNMNHEMGMNSNSNYCDVNFQDLVIEEHSAEHDLVKTQPVNETNRGTATFYKTNPAETSVTSRNITASEYILRKQQKSNYIELNTETPDPRLRGSYLCFEEALMLSDVNKVEIFKNISAKQANPVKKKLKKRDDKDLRKLVYKDETNLDNALKLQTGVTDHQISVSRKTPESSLNVLSSSPLPDPQCIDPVLDAFSDGAPQMCPPPSTNPQLLASSRLLSPVKSLESLSSSLIHNFNLLFYQNSAQESQSSNINDYSKSESSTLESRTTNTLSSPLSITEKAMANQLELKSKVESKFQLEKPFPKDLTVSLCLNDHSSPSDSMKNVANNKIPPYPAITDSIRKVQEPVTMRDAQKSRLKDIRRQSKQGSVKEREDHTLLSAIQSTQIQIYSNPYYVESNPNDTQKIEALATRQNTTKTTDQQCIDRKITRSQNLEKDVATQREGLDLSKSYENAVDGESNRNSYFTGNNYRSQIEIQSDKTVNQNTQTNYKHYDLLPDVHTNLPPPNQINQPSDAQRRQANCGLRETQMTHNPNHLNPTYPRVPATQQYYGSSIYPVCPIPIMATNNIHTIPHNNRFVDNQVFHRNPNNHDQYSPCNPVSNYQHRSMNLQSAQCSQRRITNLRYINPNSAHPTHSAHSQIRFPPPQRNMGPNMFARSYSSWINPIHPYPPQEHMTFPPLDAQKQQFIQNYAKRARPPPPQAQPNKIARRRSSMFQ